MAAIPERISLFKRSGTYYVLYYSNDKRRWKSTGVTTRPEAVKKLTEFRELLQVRAQHVSLSKFVHDFLAYAETNYRPGTLALYRHTLSRFKSIAGDVSLPEVTAEHFDKYKVKRLKEKTEVKKNPTQRSAVSVNVELRTLKAAFSAARRWKLVESNPFGEVTFADVPQAVPMFFSTADFKRLVECIKEVWLREVVVFAVLTGLRQGEILNLRWTDVDLSRRLVTIQTGATFKTKQGRRRSVPLNQAAMTLLASRQGKSASEYVFTLNDKPLFRGWVQHLFKRYVRDLKLPERLHFHSLRHTFASWLVQDGATLYEVQKLLGHSSARVTEVYSHLQPERLHGTVERIRLN